MMSKLLSLFCVLVCVYARGTCPSLVFPYASSSSVCVCVCVLSWLTFSPSFSDIWKCRSATSQRRAKQLPDRRGRRHSKLILSHQRLIFRFRECFKLCKPNSTRAGVCWCLIYSRQSPHNHHQGRFIILLWAGDEQGYCYFSSRASPVHTCCD